MELKMEKIVMRTRPSMNYDDEYNECSYEDGGNSMMTTVIKHIEDIY